MCNGGNSIRAQVDSVEHTETKANFPGAFFYEISVFFMKGGKGGYASRSLKCRTYYLVLRINIVLVNLVFSFYFCIK